MTFDFLVFLRDSKLPLMKVDRLLETYCTMDSGTKAEMLATVESFMKQRGKVVYDSVEYHHIDDLRADLEATCVPVHKSEIEHMMF